MSLDRIKQRIKQTIDELALSCPPNMTPSDLEKRTCVRLRSNAPGYLTELYRERSRETLSQPIFTSAENQLKFRELRLLQQMREACSVDDYLPSAKSAVETSDRSRSKRFPTISVVLAGVACGAVAGIVTSVLSLSPTVIVLCVVGAGVGGAVCAYLVTRQKNSESVTVSTSREGVQRTLADDMMRWLDAANALYDARVKELEMKLQ